MAEHDLPETFRLPASRQLLPLQQGELDGFCGIYSIINAIRLVRFEQSSPTTDDSAALFSFAIYRLSETGDLRDRTCTGVPWSVLKKVGNRIAAVASHENAPIKITPIKRGTPDRLRTLKQVIHSGVPIIASVHRDEHYTVMAGWTPKRAIMFDSSGGHWVPLTTVERTLCLSVSFDGFDRF